MRPSIHVNGDYRMAMWGRMPLPPIPICPHEPWEAQLTAHTDTGPGVGSNFRFVSNLEWQPANNTLV